MKVLLRSGQFTFDGGDIAALYGGDGAFTDAQPVGRLQEQDQVVGASALRPGRAVLLLSSCRVTSRATGVTRRIQGALLPVTISVDSTRGSAEAHVDFMSLLRIGLQRGAKPSAKQLVFGVASANGTFEANLCDGEYLETLVSQGEHTFYIVTEPVTSIDVRISGSREDEGVVELASGTDADAP